jgi:hypothetical protein
MTLNLTRGIGGFLFVVLIAFFIIMAYRQGQIDAVRGKIFVHKKYMNPNDSTDTKYKLEFWSAVWDKLH